MIELFEHEDFLSAEELRPLLAELRSSAATAAAVYGKDSKGTFEPLTRKTLRANVSEATAAFIRERLTLVKPEIEERFNLSLASFEEPQFLRYRTGDFFVAHQDGNTPLIYDDTRFRKISVVIFLNAQSTESLAETFEGGELLFHGSYPNYSYRLKASAKPGKLVAFRSETTHEVTPVENGERFTIVSWFRG